MKLDIYKNRLKTKIFKNINGKMILDTDRIKVIKNFSWFLCEQGIRVVSGVIIASILARILGVENYGIYNYILALVAIFQTLSFINPAEVMVPKLVTADNLARKELMGNGFFIRIFFSIVAYFALIFFIYLVGSNLELKLTIILGLMILSGESFGIVTAYLQSQTIMKYRSILSIATITIKILILLLMYINDIKNIYLYAFIVLLEQILLAIGLIFIYKHLTKELFFYFNLKKAKKLLKDGLPFFTGVILMCVFLRIDVIMVRFLSDERSLGLYSSALQLINNLKIIAPFIAMSFAPIFVYKFSDIKIIRKNIILISFLMVVIATFISLLLYFLAPCLIELIFGNKFLEATGIFKFFLLSFPFIFLNEGLNIYIIKLQLGRTMICKWLIVLVGSICCYLLLIPKFGAIGAVVGYTFGYFLASIFGVYILLKKGF